MRTLTYPTREFYAFITRLFAAFSVTFCCSAVLASDKPNILLLMAEDLSPRIGAFGDSIAQTPHIDALAERGVRFTNIFTTSGVCAPSRAATIMGLHQISFGAQHMRTSRQDYLALPPVDAKAFPELLRRQGYYTLTDAKLDYQFSGTMGDGPFTIWDVQGRKVSIEDTPLNKPFFAQINFALTHESGVFPPLGSWPNSVTHFVMQLMRSILNWSAPDGKPVAAEEITLEPYYPDTTTVREDIARHYQNISAMDTQVGQIIDHLETNGLAENTIVIWTSDHGDGLPRAKRELYDSGLKVPMVVYWPEKFRPDHLLPGSADSRLVSFVDLAPTILALAGADIPDAMHGQDIFNSTTPARKYIYASRDRIDEVPDRQRAIRSEKYKLIRSYRPKQIGGHPLAFRDNIPMMREMQSLFEEGKLNKAQSLWFEPPGVQRLFDIKNDPFELKNLANSTKHQAILKELNRELDAWLARVGDLSELSEQEMISRFQPSGQPQVTPTPTVRIGSSGVTIQSRERHASLGYSLNDGDWQLYTGPIKVKSGDLITAKAIRYGWVESEPLSVTIGNL
ncbi:MAG: sulfatase [Pseudomonadales bacterium]